MINNPYQTYGNTQVMTASPGELTLLLYNGAIRFLKQAQAAIDQGNMEDKNRYIQRTQDILFELMSTLKMEYELSNNLMELYRFMNKQLLQGNIKKDKQIIQEVIELLEDLRNTWSEALKLVRKNAVGMNNR